MNNKNDSQTGWISRRELLRAIGTGAVALGMPSALAVRAAHGAQQQRRFVIQEDRFGRISPQLPPFAAPSSKLEAALLEIGKPGGLLDAKDNLAAGPVALIVDPALNVNNPNNDGHTAGATFVGQFMDHDMTFDLTSRLGLATDPAASPNSRTPALDLDVIYGGGPIADHEAAPERGTRTAPNPLQGRERRSIRRLAPQGNTAIIADPRNDENLMIAGLHAAFLFHNKAVDLVTNNAVKLSSTESRPGSRRARRNTSSAPLDGSPCKRASRRYW